MAGSKVARIALAATAIALIGAISGCGGSSSGTSSALSGTVVQGPVSDAIVTAFAVRASDGASGVKLASTRTKSDGTFVLFLQPRPGGAVRLTVTDGSFTSEMNGASITPSGELSILLNKAPVRLEGISINPLSTFVDRLATGLAAGGQDLPDAISVATEQVESVYALSTDPGTLLPDYTAPAIGTDSGNFALILGAMINEDQYLCPDAPGGLASALAADIADGNFDGESFGVPVSYCGSTLPAIAGITDFQDALSGLVQLQYSTQAFDFGGNGNVLTANGVADLALDGTNAYPSAPLALIETAIALAAPPSVNAFANPQSAIMNDGRQDATATLLPNGKVLIAGGLGGMNPVATTDLYDPVTNTFLNPQPAVMSAARAFASAILLPNGKVLISGGTSDGMLGVASTDIYDPANNCFAGQAATACAGQAPGPMMHHERYLATTTRLPNGKVLIAGGNDGFGNIIDAELYDPVNNCFAGAAGTPCASVPLPTMNIARDAASAALLPNGKVLIAGGFVGPDATNTTELYDPSSNTFAKPQSAVMRATRFYASIAMLPTGKVLIAGGGNISGVNASADLYDPDNNCFASEAATACAGEMPPPSLNTAREAATTTLLPNGKVLIAGGDDMSLQPTTSTEIYDPVLNCFAGNAGTACANQTAPSMTLERINATGTLLTNGNVLIAGGDGGGPATTDLYTP